jgi:hypothetical protein
MWGHWAHCWPLKTEVSNVFLGLGAPGRDLVTDDNVLYYALTIAIPTARLLKSVTKSLEADARLLHCKCAHVHVTFSLSSGLNFR